MFVIFAGVGWATLPIDLINSFRFRPVPMKKDEFERRKVDLLRQVDRLRNVGQDLEKKNPKASGKKNQKGGLSGWKENRSYGRKLTDFEVKTLQLEKVMLFTIIIGIYSS
jgi:hypothetical protein